MRIVAVIPHWYHAVRGPNLQPITDSLVAQGVEVVIWNNDQPIGSINGARVIQADHNWGCQGRFEAMKHIGNPDYVLSHDNDLIASTHSIARMLSIAEAVPGQIYTGMVERRVWRGEAIVLSRSKYELVPWDTMQRILRYWKNGKESVHDDFWLSTTAHKLGIRRIPVQIRWKHYRDDVGFWRETPDFERVRQHVFEELMSSILFRTEII